MIPDLSAPKASRERTRDGPIMPEGRQLVFCLFTKTPASGMLFSVKHFLMGTGEAEYAGSAVDILLLSAGG